MKRRALILLGIGFLNATSAWAQANPHYGFMSPQPVTVPLKRHNLDDNIFESGTCDNTSDGTALHLGEDCEQLLPLGNNLKILGYVIPWPYLSP
jgi:hypothetical protein